MKVKITQKGGGLRCPGIEMLEAGTERDLPDAVAEEFIERGLATRAEKRKTEAKETKS